jgi:hypothetical protein
MKTRFLDTDGEDFTDERRRNKTKTTAEDQDRKMNREGAKDAKNN